MVTTVLDDPRYRAPPGEGFDGVVRLSVGGFSGTGALLFGGRAVLTAAHLFEPWVGTGQVHFETLGGVSSTPIAHVLRHPLYDDDGNHDLAIAWLAQPAPVWATRYELHRSGNELGQAFTLVGYGATGTGTAGAGGSIANPVRLKAENRFDADGATLKASLGGAMGWRPEPGVQLMADFDDGTAARDALGRLMGGVDLGRGLDEGLIASGDSGGPAFLAGRLAGVATYTASLSRPGVTPDLDHTANSSFGDIAAWQSVGAHLAWIDQSLRARYPEAPTTPQEVRKSVAEGASGTTLVYFLLQFTGTRDTPDAVLSVDYATRDGTARAGIDYLSAAGTLALYPGETQAVIPVEVLGDSTPEPDETLHLDVFNPVGGGFGPGVVRLTATRTIVDDDGWVG